MRRDEVERAALEIQVSGQEDYMQTLEKKRDDLEDERKKLVTTNDEMEKELKVKEENIRKRLA